MSYANGNSAVRNNNNSTFRNNGRPRPQFSRGRGNQSDGSHSTRSNSSSSSPLESKTIVIRNIDRLTPPKSLKDYFETYYKRPNTRMEHVYLNVDDNDELTGNATVVFGDFPLQHHEEKGPLIGTHIISQKRVRVEYSFDQESSDNINHNKNSNGLTMPSTRTYETDKFFARSISMGTLIDPTHFVEMWTCTEEVKYYLKYTQRRVDIFFKHLDDEYRLEYKFKDVFGDMLVERDDKQRTTIFTIPLRYPAILWKRNYDSVQETKRSIIVGPKWERVILIPLSQRHKQALAETQQAKGPLTPIKRDDVIDIGSWRVLRLVFSPTRNFERQFEEQLKTAAGYNLVPEDLNDKLPFIKETKASDLPKPWGHVERQKLDLSFDVLYLLESIISHHYLNEYNATEAFYDKLKQLDVGISYGFLQLISTSKQHVWDPLFAFQRIWDSMGMKVKVQRSIPSHCAMLHKLIITPSHLYIQPPNLETTNRVVRHYKELSDRFIRVQFMDEGFNRVGPSRDLKTKEVIYNRIYDVLKRGIQIGNRRYEFLAFSSSQLREHGCWFFAPTHDLDVRIIRNWMGVFSHEKIVAKHAVRMGQCFSSTRPVYTLQKNDMEYIKDVVHNNYTFSDGVGKISPKLAEEVALQMELKAVPSAFQFRLGGAKGVLTVDEKLAQSHVKVQLRPSQIKFESPHLTLEVIRTSTYIHGFLNRQVITLLSALGVKDEVFMELMEDMVGDVNALLKKPEEAVRVLLGNVDEAGTVMSMVPIIQAGFMERKDPYIEHLLRLFRVSILKDLKKKAKIIVPKGAYLLGVMDESNTLEEGEIFVQIFDTSNNGSSRQIITGEVVVFRNPCFHPGDVRVVKAIDKPNLHHLVDVVVFSAKGFRDIPSMCSGGDLDGDDYTVFWDPKLIPVKKNYDPMDYTAAQPKLVEDVTIKDITKFFVNYINNDNLGQIANAHLATADLAAHGARDGKCILLAQLHSEAVDFPKTGKAARMTEDLTVKSFPDFMQKKDKESYKSEKVLGRIFRRIDKSDYKDYKSGLEEDMENIEYDTRLRVPGMELYIEEARELRQKYNRSLSAMMNQFGVQTEAEICSGYIIKWLKKSNSKTKYEQHDYTMNAVKAFKALWKKEFEKEFYDANKKMDYSLRDKIEQKAAAWYYVTYHKSEREKDISFEGGFLSFPWVIYDHICDIAKRNTHKKLNDINSQEAIDEDTIKKGAEKLRADRGNVTVVVEVSDDEDEDRDGIDGLEYESESDGEVYTFNVTNSKYPNTAHGSAATAAVATAMGRPANNNVNTIGSIFNPITPRPLESHQSIISADATTEELTRALLG